MTNEESVEGLLDQVQSQADAVAAVAGVTPRVEAPPAGAGVDVPSPAAPAMDPFAGAMTAPAESDVGRLLAIEVPVIVQLGMRRMTVGEVMRLAVGAIVEFHKPSDEELDLLANNKPIGKGHAVKVGENFGIKITTIGTVKETIRKLGGA
ncbi:MAG TPA: FliM/FliN family flagellar motor switch protein [Phycisphaerae bacterium]|nr:FliM/FliN family flagellar motor switch protein [Phycisphaerae bacterium]